uniref:Pyrroline-5-carboxylate reductase ucsG n=1 Tax=Acremonium sp. TaxID=2046025 RepID=UCSG_ACRSP|nr:RecName: Full=Pyrroline-5-carboxylate reductase ucsG; AltName: Full=UCS1025A pyrrolizidinone biosynthesis cluster protein G [Acremonium sp.]QBC88151.1 UcsG [Acremonium sp.]
MRNGAHRCESAMPGVTMTVLGCGKLGTAIIQGLLRSCPKASEAAPQKYLYPISTVIAAVRSKDRLESLIKSLVAEINDHTCPLDFVIANNVEAVRRADVVFLACHPNQATECLGGIGMQDAISGKLVISVLGGVSVATLEQAVYSSTRRPASGQAPCHIVQAIANTAAARQQSVTVVAEEETANSHEKGSLCEDVLRRLGQVSYVSPDLMPAVTALCASGTAFFTTYLDAMIQGAVSEGLGEDVATRLAALTMAGAANAVISGEHPAAVTSRVTTPGGVTAEGLKVLREGDLRTLTAKAISATTRRLRLVDEKSRKQS